MVLKLFEHVIIAQLNTVSRPFDKSSVISVCFNFAHIIPVKYV